MSSQFGNSAPQSYQVDELEPAQQLNSASAAIKRILTLDLLEADDLAIVTESSRKNLRGVPGTNKASSSNVGHRTKGKPSFASRTKKRRERAACANTGLHVESMASKRRRGCRATSSMGSDASQLVRLTQAQCRALFDAIDCACSLLF